MKFSVTGIFAAVAVACASLMPSQPAAAAIVLLTYSGTFGYSANPFELNLLFDEGADPLSGGKLLAASLTDDGGTLDFDMEGVVGVDQLVADTWRVSGFSVQKTLPDGSIVIGYLVTSLVSRGMPGLRNEAVDLNGHIIPESWYDDIAHQSEDPNSAFRHNQFAFYTNGPGNNGNYPYAWGHLNSTHLKVTPLFGPDTSSACCISLRVPIPEPTTWALMILGFGLAGGGLRRGRKLRSA